jgi:hypothetical protein
VRHLVIAVAVLGLGASARDPGARVTQLTWLAGCWEQAAGPRLVEEQWTRPRAGLMLGSGRTVRADTLVEFEQTRIFERGGRLVYGANPSGQAPAEFESIELSDSSVTFENPAHDFPQRVMYRRRGADSLIGRVEGSRGGKVRGVDFPYARVACP